MKKSLYNLAYRVVSRLSDLTGGRPLFVKWKVALATVILGFSTASFTSCKPTCYEPAVTCYVTEEPAPEPEEQDNAEGNEAKADSGAFTEAAGESGGDRTDGFPG